MFTLTINDRELRALAQVIETMRPKRKHHMSPEFVSLEAKVMAIIYANIDALERIDEAEGGT